MRVRKREDVAHSDTGARDGEDTKLVVGRCGRLCLCRNTIQLCSIAEVPSWAQRPHILDGYRPNLSFWQCLLSLFSCHNETGNIWTHLLGAMIVASLGFKKLMNDESSPKPFGAELLANEMRVRLTFIFAAVVCLGVSAVYHAGNCTHDEVCCTALLRADTSGIAILIAASFLPGVYLGFACFPSLQMTYLGVVAVLLLLGLAVSFADCFDNNPSKEDDSAFGVSQVEENVTEGSIARQSAAPKVHLSRRLLRKAMIQQVRIMTFSCFVALGFAVALHWCFMVSPQARSKYVSRIGSMLGSYALGFFFYASHYPERRWPGCFDFWLHSHQIWHICVVMAVIVWWHACEVLVDELGQSGCHGFIDLQGTPREGVVGLRAGNMQH